MHTDDIQRWTAVIHDKLADAGSSIREGLTDDEARPLMDWGVDQAPRLAARLAGPDTPAPSDDQVKEAAHALTRLMTRITWVVTYRDQKDDEWLMRTLVKINQLSQEVYGPDAPQLSDEEIARWIAARGQHNTGELVQGLVERYTPATTAPAEPPAEPPAAGPTPLSNVLSGLGHAPTPEPPGPGFGSLPGRPEPRLPGRSPIDDAPPRDQTSQDGDIHE